MQGRYSCLGPKVFGDRDVGEERASVTGRRPAEAANCSFSTIEILCMETDADEADQETKSPAYLSERSTSQT